MTSAIIRRITVLAATVILLALARQAQAAPLYSCPDGADCSGTTFAVEVSQVGDDYTLDFWINTTGYTGAESDFIKAIALKSFVGDAGFDNITAEALVIAPGGVGNWDFYYNELTNVGGSGGCSGGNLKNFCAQADSTFEGGKGYNFTIGDELQWRFTFTYPDALGSTVHVKYLFVDSEGDKAKGLGSFDLNITETDPCPEPCGPGGHGIPEPATLTLLGVGLAAVGARFRRRR